MSVEGGAHWLSVGRGANVSAYRSVDHGAAWLSVAVDRNKLSGQAGQCPVGDDGRAFRIELDASGEVLIVSSRNTSGIVHRARLANGTMRVVGASCDGETMVVGLQHAKQKAVQLFSCPYAASCSALKGPQLDGKNRSLQFPLDLAQVDGTTVLSVTEGGLVRIATSRDGGQTWTPFVVVFDRAEYPENQTDVKIAGRLLRVGSELLLYGGAANAKATYPQLRSKDHGASWHAAN